VIDARGRREARGCANTPRTQRLRPQRRVRGVLCIPPEAECLASRRFTTALLELRDLNLAMGAIAIANRAFASAPHRPGHPGVSDAFATKPAADFASEAETWPSRRKTRQAKRPGGSFPEPLASRDCRHTRRGAVPVSAWRTPSQAPRVETG